MSNCTNSCAVSDEGTDLSIYLVNMAFLLLWAALLLWHKPDRLKRKVFCIVASSQWVLLSGLRHISVGADTYGYKLYSFDPALSTTWSEVFRIVMGTYFGPLEVKDPGYLVVVKVLQLVSHDYQVFLLLIALIFTVPLGVYIYKYSAEPLLSFLIYSGLFSSFFAITGIRQTVATALVVLIGYRFVERRRLWPFVLLSLVAFTIHRSSIAFFPFYFLSTRKVTFSHVMVFLAAAPAMYIFRGPIALFIGGPLGYERYARQFSGAGTWTFSAMLVLVVVVMLWRAPFILGTQPSATMWYNAILIALALAPLTFLDPSAMRAVQYYSIFLLLLVPAILTSFNNRSERLLGYLVAVSVLVALFARGAQQYLFFWQGP